MNALRHIDLDSTLNVTTVGLIGLLTCVGLIMAFVA
jgi:hypothetical protein